MTVHRSASAPLALSISSLLRPRDDAKRAGPPDTLPYPIATLLGPLPATSPLHLALNYLTLADLPEYDTAIQKAHTPVQSNASSLPEAVVPRTPSRALIVNCSPIWSADIEDEDEDWLRDNGAQYGIMEQLSRVDIRFCPSPKHLLLLLTLLTTSEASTSSSDGPHELQTPPGLIILYDAAGLFMRLKETDENLPPGLDETDEPRAQGRGEMEFEPGTAVSDYLNLVAAAKATLHHFASTSNSTPQLVVLETHLSSSWYFPILKPAAAKDQRGTLATPVREKKVNVREALEHVLGRESIGVIEVEAPDPDAGPDDPDTYSLTFGDNDEQSYRMKKRRCERNPWARAVAAAEEDEEVLKNLGGWRWEWV